MIIFITALMLLMVVYIPGSGGEGVSLPFNLIFLFWCSLFVIYLVWCKNFQMRYVKLSLDSITLGVLLLIIPWLIYIKNSPGVIILILALLFYILLNHVRIENDTRKKVLQVLFLIAIVQALIGFVQTFQANLAQRWFEYDWMRNNGRPYGIFQQVNLFASFLATGAGCGYLLYLLEMRKVIRNLYLCGLGLIAFALALNLSRTGALGGLLVLSLLTLLFVFGHNRRCVGAIVTISFCSLAGIWVTQHLHITLETHHLPLGRQYAGSNNERMSILNVVWKMIQENPWQGWGYGMFSAQLTRYVMLHPELLKSNLAVITHPHNEILFMWFQGGVLALAGMLLVAAGWVKNLVRALRMGPVEGGYALLVLPIMLHLNLEYPFYQSFFHLAVFVLLLRLCSQDPEKDLSMDVRQRLGIIYRVAITFIAVTLFGFCFFGLHANSKLTAYERLGLVNFPASMPWYFHTLSQRAEFDSMVALLVNYNQTHDKSNLDHFVKHAEYWISQRTDRNVLLSLITIFKSRGELQKAAVYEQIYDALPAA